MSYYPSWYSKEEIKRIEEAERRKMKGIRGSIIAGAAILLVIVLVIMCSVRVPAGYVAVQYSLNGGVKDKVLTQGWHLISPTVKTTKYTVGIEQSYLTSDKRGDSEDDESFTASSAEGKAIDIDLTFTYQYQPESVTKVFTQFKGQSGKEVRDSFIKPNIISWTKEVVARYNVADILGAEKANVNIALTEYISKKFAPYGITISNVSLINVGVDKKTREVINDKIAAQQKAETQKIENQTKVEKAEADAKAKLIEAEAEAKANQLIQKSLTDGVLKQQYIEKWNGELPKVSSEGSMMYNLNDMN
jgi:regulator of protease activity HflC (stomatin/prohibitin superfamily)